MQALKFALKTVLEKKIIWLGGNVNILQLYQYAPHFFINYLFVFLELLAYTKYL